MTDGGHEPYERFFTPRDLDGSGDGDDGSDRTPVPPSTPQHRGAPAEAQQLLMARIAAGRQRRQRLAFLAGSGLVSALLLFVAGAGWVLGSHASHVAVRTAAGTSAVPAGSPVNFLTPATGQPTGSTLARHHHPQARVRHQRAGAGHARHQHLAGHRRDRERLRRSERRALDRRQDERAAIRAHRFARLWAASQHAPAGQPAPPRVAGAP
jgi:hypothetical protein